MYIFWDVLFGNTLGLLMLKWFERIAAAKYNSAIKNCVFVDNFRFSFSAFLLSFFNMWLISVLIVLFFVCLLPCLCSVLLFESLPSIDKSLEDPISHIAVT